MLRNLFLILFFIVCNYNSSYNVFAATHGNNNSVEKITSNSDALIFPDSELIDEVNDNDLSRHKAALSINQYNYSVSNHKSLKTENKFLDDQSLLIFNIDLPPPAIS